MLAGKEVFVEGIQKFVSRRDKCWNTGRSCIGKYLIVYNKTTLVSLLLQNGHYFQHDARVVHRPKLYFRK